MSRQTCPFLNYYDRRGDELSRVNVDVQGQIFPFDGSGLVLILTGAVSKLKKVSWIRIKFAKMSKR